MQGITKKAAFSETGYKKRQNPAIWTGTSGFFSIELWERFGYYGLQGIMAVYLVKQLGMSEADSITLFSSFSALVYGLVAIGGWLGDKVLGTKRVIMLGAVVLAIGYALVAWSGHDAGIVYMGMAAIAVGNGLFKANPSSLLSTCYAKDDPRLDGAFTMYYMSVTQPAKTPSCTRRDPTRRSPWIMWNPCAMRWHDLPYLACASSGLIS